MKKLVVTALLLTLLCTLTMCQKGKDAASNEEIEAIATEAYIYGYPLVTMEMTRRVMTNVASPTDLKAPMGQFVNARTYPDPSFHDVTAPNADTLYSSAWINLAKEPYVLHVPDEKGRYYVMEMLSAWTDVFDSPGTRTTGTAAANFAITGPGWKGDLPKDVKQIKSPTNLIWILGRTYCTGTPEDYEAVHKIQDQYTLTPLSAFGKNYTPAPGVVDSKIDLKTPVRDQVNHLSGEEFFQILSTLMKENPPSKEDAPIIAKMAKIGVVPGQDFDITKLDKKIVDAITKAPKSAILKIMEHVNHVGKIENGWKFTTDTGVYGTNYIQRATITAVGLGANLPEDAIYPTADVDNEGNALRGDQHYVIHFEKGQTPPARGFWSITMYNDQYFFVSNPLNRYSVSPRNEFKLNSDGSLDIYIQNESPGKDKESNWLPAPKDKFILMMRIYWPEESVIKGDWKPPVVKLVEANSQKADRS